MRLKLFVLLLFPLLMGAGTIQWDEVTTDITGAPAIAASYKVYSRLVGTADPFVELGATFSLSFPLPTPSAKREYVITALDLAGEESDMSLSATGKPDTPNKPTIRKGAPTS